MPNKHTLRIVFIIWASLYWFFFLLILNSDFSDLSLAHGEGSFLFSLFLPVVKELNLHDYWAVHTCILAYSVQMVSRGKQCRYCHPMCLCNTEMDLHVLILLLRTFSLISGASWVLSTQPSAARDWIIKPFSQMRLCKNLMFWNWTLCRMGWNWPCSLETIKTGLNDINLLNTWYWLYKLCLLETSNNLSSLLSKLIDSSSLKQFFPFFPFDSEMELLFYATSSKVSNHYPWAKSQNCDIPCTLKLPFTSKFKLCSL